MIPEYTPTQQKSVNEIVGRTLCQISKNHPDKIMYALCSLFPDLNPLAESHISPFPYGIAYAREKMFDIITMKTTDTTEPEEIVEMFFDKDFGTDRCKGEYQGISQQFQKQLPKYSVFNEIEYYRAYTLFKGYLLLSALSKAWSRHKVVYKPDTDFLNHLLKADDFEFPPSVFRYLPETSFYIDLSSFIFPNIKGMFGLVLSDSKKITILSYICRVDMVNINHPEDFLWEDSGVYYPYISCQLDIDDKMAFTEWLQDPGNLTVTVPIPRMFQNKYTEMIGTENRDIITQSVVLRQVLIKLMMFLACKEPDLIYDRQLKKERKRLERLKKELDEQLEVWEVGARYGAVIREQERKEQKSVISSGQGKKKKAHIRSAHFQTYYVGKGRCDTRINFISSIIVNGKIKDLVPIIHRLTDVEPKGSVGEELIREYLTSRDYAYIKEYWVKDISARYDFVLFIEKSMFAIEFDGEQHFRPVKEWDGQKGYEERKEKDQIKNKWCYENNIPLLRIRYDQKPILNELIDNFLANPQIGTVNNVKSDQDYYSICK